MVALIRQGMRVACECGRVVKTKDRRQETGDRGQRTQDGYSRPATQQLPRPRAATRAIAPCCCCWCSAAGVLLLVFCCWCSAAAAAVGGWAGAPGAERNAVEAFAGRVRHRGVLVAEERHVGGATALQLEVRERPKVREQLLGLCLVQGPWQPGDAKPAVGGRRGAAAASNRGLRVSGLPRTLDEAQTKQLLTHFGPLAHFQLQRGGTSNVALLSYQDPSVTDSACESLNGIPLGARCARPPAYSSSSGRTPAAEHQQQNTSSRTPATAAGGNCSRCSTWAR